MSQVINFLGSLKERVQNALRRKPNLFLRRLEEQAALLVQGAEALDIYMKKPSKKKAQQVKAFEQEGDELRRIFIDELNRSFITPIDREDLFALSRMIDDVLDHIDTITNDMDALRVKPNGDLQAMTTMLYKVTQEILLAIQRLEHHPNVATMHVVRLKSIENNMEAHYSVALAKLYESEVKDVDEMMHILKLRDMYRLIQQAGSVAEETGNLISHVVVKSF